MVNFELKNRERNKLIYEYYPEGKKNKRPGLITIDLITEEYEVELAEDDYLCSTSLEELIEMRNFINQMKLEEEGTEVTEDEFSILTKGL